MKCQRMIFSQIQKCNSQSLFLDIEKKQDSAFIFKIPVSAHDQISPSVPFNNLQWLSQRSGFVFPVTNCFSFLF